MLWIEIFGSCFNSMGLLRKGLSTLIFKNKVCKGKPSIPPVLLGFSQNKEKGESHFDQTHP